MSLVPFLCILIMKYFVIELNQERIMREREKGKERDTTTHFIKIQVFTHASHVTKFSTERSCAY